MDTSFGILCQAVCGRYIVKERIHVKGSKPFAAVLCGVLSAALLATPALAATAPNDLRNHWAQTQVYTLMQHQVIAGYPDHTFRPDQPVTRQEAAGLVYNLLLERGVPLAGSPSQDIQEQVKGDTYPDPQPAEELSAIYADLDASWAKDKILSLQANGVLPQDSTGLFHPTQNLTRGEAAQLLYESIRRWPDQLSFSVVNPDPKPLYDMSGRPEAEAVWFLQQLGIVSGREDGAFCPDDSISRAEFSVLLLHLSGYPELTEVEFDPLPVCTVIPTPYISQVYPSGAWVGCEPTSLLMGLKAKGYALDVTLDQFLAALPKTESNPAKGFVGSPYVPSETLRTTIYPAPLAEFGSQYGNVKDFSGKSVEELREEVLLGNPVVIYVTLYWKQPYYRNFNIEGTAQRLLRNNHAVLVCGYDATTQMYYIADPYNINDRYHDYFYWISADVLDPLYMVRQHAVAVE